MERKDIKVLLVDDEVAFIDTLAQRLNMRNLKVETAYNGEHALLTIKENQPDIIILDLNMPDMHGIEVLKEIKKDYPDIQVIILTGHGTDKDEEEAIRLGGYDFLKKPADIETLEQKIKAAFTEKIKKMK